MSLSRTQIVNWLTRCGDIFSTESEYLTGLDREIGDADHGLNMNRGFSKVVEKLPAIADKEDKSDIKLLLCYLKIPKNHFSLYLCTIALLRAIYCTKLGYITYNSINRQSQQHLFQYAFVLLIIPTHSRHTQILSPTYNQQSSSAHFRSSY
jgi:hypothetical protein